MDDASHPGDALMNIVTGQITHSDVNAEDDISPGQQPISDFRGGWQGSFYYPQAGCHN